MKNIKDSDLLALCKKFYPNYDLVDETNKKIVRDSLSETFEEALKESFEEARTK